MWSLSNIATSIDQWLNETFNPTLALILEMLIAGVAVIGLFAMLGLILVIMERKVSAWIQIRLGPNRVGPKGMFQSLADTLKLLVKEGMTPGGADKLLFNVAPFVAMIVAMLLMAPIAFAKDFQLWDLNIGVLYITAVSSISVISILMAGWASNNKYSLLGAMRSGAQIVSYELSAGLAILAIVVLTGSLRISDIINAQADGWWIFKGHIPAIISFIIFIIAVTAETNRAPFDLPEAESELVSGYNTGYTGMRFGFFALAEYIEVFVVSGVATALFLGGSNLPVNIEVDFLPLQFVEVIIFVTKAALLYYVVIWIRWTLPRLRVDQLMSICWKYLTPIAIFNLVGCAIWMVAFNGKSLAELIFGH